MNLQKLKLCEDAAGICHLSFTPEELLIVTVTPYTSSAHALRVKYYACEARLAFVPLPNAQSFKRSSLVLELHSGMKVDSV